MHQQSLEKRIAKFLDGRPHVVVGASADRTKYGNKVLRAYMQAGREVLPVNPRESEIEGLTAYTSLDLLPVLAHGVSIVTPPGVTKLIVQCAIDLRIKHLWIQPGAVDEEAVQLALSHNCNVIAGDACILVVLGYSERRC